MKKRVIVEVICYMLLLLFINVGFSKLLDLGDFKDDLSRSPLLESFVNLIAIPLPLIEIAVGVGLLFRRTRKMALLASVVLMLIFTGYTFYLLTFAPTIPCACGGIFRYLTWHGHLWVNSTFLVLAVIALWLSKRTTTKQILVDETELLAT